MWLNRATALFALAQSNEAMASLDRALEILDRALETEDADSVSEWVRFGAHVMKFAVFASEGKTNSAKREWREALGSSKPGHLEQVLGPLSQLLLELARAGDLAVVRDLISEAGLDERLFPMARAIDYILSGDEALIEKLSPEIRGIVEEIVGKLRDTANKAKVPKTRTRTNGIRTKKKSKVPKTKPGSRNRVRKQLL